MRRAIVRTWLFARYDWAAGRIAAGDLDFDNRIYRTRDATAELLGLFFEEDPRQLSASSDPKPDEQ